MNKPITLSQKPAPPVAPKQPSRLERIIGFPKWAWVVSGLPGVNFKTSKPWYIRASLITAYHLRKMYYPLKSFRIVILSLIAIIICYLIPQRHSGIGHFFVISSSAAAIQLLTVIIGSLSAILAVIFSIVLVVVGVIRKYAYRGKISSVFGYYPLRELLLFYGVVVVSSMYVLATIGQSLTLRSIHLIDLEVYLYIAALIGLYPAMRSLLDVTDPVSSVPRQLKEIKKGVAQFGRFAMAGESEIIPAEAAHPIFVLRDIAIKALAENDEVTTIQIVNSMSKRLGELVKEEPAPEERRSIIGAFILVWRSIMIRAVRLESEGVLLCLLEAIKSINLDTSKRDFKWFELMELDRFHFELISKAIEAGFEEVAIRGIYLVEGSLEWNIPNIPPAKDLYSFAKHVKGEVWNSDSDRELKWEHLTSEPIRLLSNICSVAIKFNNENVTRAAISNLSALIPKINDAKQLSDKQKGVTIAQLSWSIRDAVVEALDNMEMSQFFLLMPGISDFDYRGLMTSNKEYSKFPFIYYKDMYRKAISKDQLTSFTIDPIRMAAYSLVNKLKTGSFKRVHKLLMYLIVLLDDIREHSKDRKTEQAKECYLAAYDKMKDIQKIVKELNDDEINSAIKNNLKKFKDITALRKTRNHYDDLW
jgi:hypothetical protein